MSGRVKRGFWNDDGLWIQYWQTLGDPVDETPEAEDYTPELILAWAALTDKQRFVIECSYGFRGPAMTEREIAGLMGISQQGVNQLIQRGLGVLRRGLSKSPMGAKGSISETGEVPPNVLRMDQGRVLEEPTE